jgi:predicted aspartyl protease
MLGLVASMALLEGCSTSYRADVIDPPMASGQSLPVTFVLNLPVIEVGIGDQMLKLIVDVGGHDNITLTAAALKRLPIVTHTGVSHMSFNAAGKLTRDAEIIVPELRLGEVVLWNVTGHELQLPEQLADKVDGYVGAALLKRFRLLVEYPDAIVLLPASAPRETDGIDVSTWTALRINDMQRTAAAIDGTAIIAGWDTGASHTVMDNDLAKKLFDRDSGTVECALTLDGRTFDFIEMRIIELRGARVDVIVGHSFFARHRVLFDFPNGMVYVEPAPKGASAAQLIEINPHFRVSTFRRFSV